MEELKTCPFCGGEASELRTHGIGGDDGMYHVVTCERCWGKTSFFDTAEEAVAAWNSRTDCKPKPIESPFEIGDVIECEKPGWQYEGHFEVIGESTYYMRLMSMDGKFAGDKFNKHKNILRNEWHKAVS